MTTKLKEQFSAILISVSLSAVTAGVVMWQQNAVMANQITQLERRFEEQAKVNSEVAGEIKSVYKLSGQLEQINMELKGLREDLKGRELRDNNSSRSR